MSEYERVKGLMGKDGKTYLRDMSGKIKPYYLRKKPPRDK
jgi:hypothetical protein